MAESKCPKCESAKFEARPFKPGEAVAEILFVQCAECGCVVGALEATKVGALVQEKHAHLMGFLAAMDQRLIALQFKS